MATFFSNMMAPHLGSGDTATVSLPTAKRPRDAHIHVQRQLTEVAEPEHHRGLFLRTRWATVGVSVGSGGLRSL